MAKEGAPRSEDKPRKVTYEQIAWDPIVSERNREVVKGLLDMGEVTSRKIVMPGTTEQPHKEQPPTKLKIRGVELFVSSFGNGFYQAHVDGKEADPVPYAKEASAKEILVNIQEEVVFLMKKSS